MTAQTPTADRKPKRWPWIVLGVFLGIFLGVGLGSASGGKSATTGTAASPVTETVTETVTVTAEAPKPVEPPKPAGPATSMENGTYLVGTDIEPGRYRSPGVDGSLCYYDQTNDKGDILDQGVAPSGPSIADLKAGRKFKSSGCQPWTKIG